MHRDAGSILAEAAAEVLERMFFTGIVGECAERPDNRGEEIAVRVIFQGSVSGVLELALGDGAHAIAANFLGVDGAVPEEQAVEVAGEMANMICGSFLSRLERSGDFRLSTAAPVGPEGEANSLVSKVYQLEEGILTLRLKVDGRS